VPSNSEILRLAYDAWARDDRDAWLALLDPEVVIRTSGVFPDFAPEYRGHEQAARFWRQLREPWEVFRIDPERIEEDGDCVFAEIRFRAKGVDSGVEVDMRFGMALRMRDGLAVEIVNRRSVGEARKALGPARTAEPHAVAHPDAS
jgi:ketosteroid isomerase-like protein